MFETLVPTPIGGEGVGEGGRVHMILNNGVSEARALNLEERSAVEVADYLCLSVQRDLKGHREAQ